MLNEEVIDIYSENHTKHTLCGHNIKILNVEHAGAYSHHWAGVSCAAFPLLLNTVPPISEPFIYNGKSFSIPC